MGLKNQFLRCVQIRQLTLRYKMYHSHKLYLRIRTFTFVIFWYATFGNIYFIFQSSNLRSIQNMTRFEPTASRLKAL